MKPDSVARLNTGRFRLLTLAVGLSMVLDLSASPPAITHQPENETVALNHQAVFAVIASGTSPLAYQWRKNASGIAGATNDQLVLTNVQFSDRGLYSVIVSNAENSVTSADASLSVNAPAPGDVDCSFPWGDMINHRVWSVAVQPDGKVLIGGDFTATHGVARSAIARLNADGSSDHAFMNGLSGANGSIYAIALQSDGRILIGGYFSTVNGLAHHRVARLHRDGSLDSGFLNRSAIDKIYSIAVQSDGKAIIGGDFYSNAPLGPFRNRIARLNPDGTVDDHFMEGLPGITNGIVRSLVLQDDGKVIVAGDFTRVNGVPRNRIARLNPDGTLDTSFLNGVSGADKQIWSIALQGAGKIVIGGIFTNVNGISRNRIARLNPDGTLDNSFMNGLAGANADVISVTAQSDGKLVIGGYFSRVDGVPRNLIARLNEDGTVDSAFLNSGSGANDWVLAMSPQEDDKLIIGGSFTMVNGLVRMRIARLNADGTLDESFVNQSSGLESYRFGTLFAVKSMALQSDGKVLIGGRFSHFSGVSRQNTARLNTNGEVDNTFQTFVEGGVETMVVQSDDKVLISGGLGYVWGTLRGSVVRLNANGTLDTSFLAGLSNGYVRSFGLQSDGKIVVGGNFTEVNGLTRNRIARLNSDGTLDGSFQNGLAGANYPVLSVALQSDGKILIGGEFDTVNGVARNRIARLNPDGTLDSSFLDLTDAYQVTSMAIQSDGKVLISAKSFVSTKLVARLNPNGSLDPSFPGVRVDGATIYSLVLQRDGKILVGGIFSVNGVTRMMARLNADGSFDNSFLKGLSGPNDYVYEAIAQRDGKVLIGGAFTSVNGIRAIGVARLWGEQQPPYIEGLSRSNGGNVSLNLRLTGGTTNRLQYNTTLSNPNWTDLPGDIVMGGSNGSTNKVDATLGTEQQRFYRIWQLP